MVAENRKYAKSHEWVMVEGEIATVGISDHAQDALGDITFVELPEVDDELSQGEDCAVVESVKAASDLYAPLSGTVCEVNQELEDSPELLNEDCYDKGWIFKITDLNLSELEALLDAAGYTEQLKSEA